MEWRQGTGDPYALLASLLAEEMGAAPLPEMARLPGGKPWFPAHPGLSFNVSHSGGLCLCALAHVPVGCDIEVVKPRRESLPRYVLDRRELKWFQDRGSAWADFYTLWTLKEAKVKCTGQGLRFPPREISVPLLEPGQAAGWEGFTFTALAGESWRGAVCVENRKKK